MLSFLNKFCYHDLLQQSTDAKREKLSKLKDMTINMEKTEQVQDLMVQNSLIEYFGIEIHKLMPQMREEQFYLVLDIFAIL